MTTTSKILLVDDCRINQSVTAILFKKLGIKIDSAYNGKEAISKLEDGDYDIILMDVNMPVLDGLSASRQIRSMNSPKSGVKIVAMTGNDSEEDMRECLRAGMNDHISKPVHLDHLFRVIDMLPGSLSKTG